MIVEDELINRRVDNKVEGLLKEYQDLGLKMPRNINFDAKDEYVMKLIKQSDITKVSKEVSVQGFSKVTAFFRIFDNNKDKIFYYLTEKRKSKDRRDMEIVLFGYTMIALKILWEYTYPKCL